MRNPVVRIHGSGSVSNTAENRTHSAINSTVRILIKYNSEDRDENVGRILRVPPEGAA
jgi:hypothetical protein